MADPVNQLALSDEDFLNQPHPPQADGVSADETASTDANNNSQQQETQENADGASGKAETSSEGAQDADATGDGTDEDGTSGTVADPRTDGEDTDGTGSGEADDKSAEDVKAQEKKDGAVDGAAAPGSGAAEGGEVAKTPDNGSEKAPDYVGFYKQIMSPFTANGKKIELKDPKEAIQLMQMGANYTRKLQEMAPHRKLITMLGNHGLLDESKLSFFIALDKKDPEAIKKLIVDSGIDPLDIDTKIEPAYQEGSYQVTDEEVAFRTQLEDLTSSDEGKQTLRIINDDWDQASKDMLWQHPEVMPIIQSHREEGIYSRITEEMDRRRTLGQLLPATPFLEAYKAIGDELHASGAFKSTGDPEQGAEQTGAVGQTQSGASAEKPAPAVVATARAAAPRPSVDNGDKAGAASPSRSAPGKAKEAVNFLSMSDEDFLKASNLEGRV